GWSVAMSSICLQARPPSGTCERDRSRFRQKRGPPQVTTNNGPFDRQRAGKSCSSGWLLPAEQATWKRPTGLFRSPKKEVPESIPHVPLEMLEHRVDGRAVLIEICE